MKKLLLTLVAAALGSAILSGGSALADDDDYGLLATGFTFCPADNVAVFPATNVGKWGVWVWVSCVDGAGNQFGTLGGDPGPAKGKIGGGEAVILAKQCENLIEPLGGELVRCSVWGKNKFLQRVRGVLHICEGVEDVESFPFDGCDLTEALLFNYDD